MSIEPKTMDKMTLTTHFGTSVIIRILFRLKQTLATHKRAISTILTTVKWQFAYVYLDYIVV